MRTTFVLCAVLAALARFGVAVDSDDDAAINRALYGIDAQTASEAVDALAQRGTSDARERIAETLTGNHPPAVMATALKRLHAFGPAAADHLPAIHATLDHHDPTVSREAMRLTAALGDHSAIPLLIDHTADPELAAAASESLAQLTGRDLGADTQSWRDWSRKHESHVSTHMQATGALLESEDPVDVVRGIQRLRMLDHHDTTVARILAGMALHPNDQVRSAAATCLGTMDTAIAARVRELAATPEGRDQLLRIYADPALPGGSAALGDVPRLTDADPASADADADESDDATSASPGLPVGLILFLLAIAGVLGWILFGSGRRENAS
ncbi:MAG: HEAT repeat domain-containing protein [Planctomycetota bacterium]